MNQRGSSLAQARLAQSRDREIIERLVSMDISDPALFHKRDCSYELIISFSLAEASALSRVN
jgi:hypothetical protein